MPLPMTPAPSTATRRIGLLMARTILYPGRVRAAVVVAAAVLLAGCPYDARLLETDAARDGRMIDADPNAPDGRPDGVVDASEIDATTAVACNPTTCPTGTCNAGYCEIDCGPDCDCPPTGVD